MWDGGQGSVGLGPASGWGSLWRPSAKYGRIAAFDLPQIVRPQVVDLDIDGALAIARVARAHVVPEASLAAAITASRAKRFVDVVLSAILLLLLAPLMVLLAAAIAVESGFPILYANKRIAVDRRRGTRHKPGERTFTCWKFRTMVPDAEGMREQLLSLNTAPFPAFKVPNDPRVTRVGRFLRKSSLDELPQLWSVLRGEMSLVGPRPPLPHEVAHYDQFALQRLSVRPGLTCVWQIDHRHRGESSFQEWVEQDLEYIRNWSLARDFVLLWKTVFAVVRMTGS